MNEERDIKTLRLNLEYIQGRILKRLNDWTRLTLTLLVISLIFALIVDISWLSGLTDGYLTKEVLSHAKIPWPVLLSNFPFLLFAIYTEFCDPDITKAIYRMRETDLTEQTALQYLKWVEDLPLEGLIRNIKNEKIILRFQKPGSEEWSYEAITFLDYLNITDFIYKMQVGIYKGVKLGIDWNTFDFTLKEFQDSRKIKLPIRITFLKEVKKKKDRNINFTGEMIIIKLRLKDKMALMKKLREHEMGKIDKEWMEDNIREAVKNLFQE